MIFFLIEYKEEIKKMVLIQQISNQPKISDKDNLAN